MFNLNEQINKWRSTLAQSKILAKADIDELESHLREEMEHINTTKLSEHEVFLIAAHRLGSPENLLHEYEKINRGVVFRQKSFWIIAIVLTYFLTIYLAPAILKGCIRLAISCGISGYSDLGLIGFASQILTLAATVCLCYFFYRLIYSRVFEKRISRITTRMTFLIALLTFLVTFYIYGMFFHIPVPGFRNITVSINEQVAWALTYSKIIWILLLPTIFVTALIRLRRTGPHNASI